MTVRTVSPHDLADLLNSGARVDLIDVRTPAEFREVHVQGAQSVPLERLNPQEVMTRRNGTAGQTLYVLCRSGSRGKQACERFQAAGFDNVVNVEGGTLACEQAGLPVVRGKKAISLERQVRFTIGLLVFLGAVLAVLVHPWFVALSGSCGAGLMYAAVTEKCPMTSLLAGLPWNQVRDEEPKSCCAC